MDIQLLKVYYDSPIYNHSISDIIDIYGGVLFDIFEEIGKQSMYVIENTFGFIYDTCMNILQFYMINYTNCNIFIIMMLLIYVISLLQFLLIQSDRLMKKSNEISNDTTYELPYELQRINRSVKTETYKLLKSIENMFEYKNGGEIIEFKRKLKKILDNDDDRSAKKISRINIMMAFDNFNFEDHEIDEDVQKDLINIKKKLKQH
jgi:hypothetical protein